MKWVVIALAIGALVTGFKAAFHWRESSEVEIDPGWTSQNPEPVIPALRQMQWNAAIIEAAKKSAALNKVAARWTMAAVAFGATCSILGALISN